MRGAGLLSGRAGFWWVTAGATLLYSVAAVLSPIPEPFRKYSAAAEALLEGALETERLLDFSPLYFALSMGLERFSPAPERTLEWLQILLAGLAVGGLFVLLRRRFPLALAAAGTAIFALDRQLLVYQRILEPETLLLALVVGLLLCLEAGSAKAALGAGLLAAACLTTRPTFLPLFFLVPAYYRFFSDPPRSGSEVDGKSPAEWRERSLLFLTPVALAVLVLGFYGRSVSGSWRPPVMNPGTVFFEGNQPLSQGTSAIYPPLVLAMVRHSGDRPDSAHEHYREVVRAAEPDATPAQVNAIWLGRARAHLLDSPARTLVQLGRKLTYAFHGFRWHDVPAAWRLDHRLRWPALPFSIVSSLALLGLLAQLRRWRPALLFYLLAGMQLAVMTIFYVSVRQRLVMLPALVFFAIAGVEWIRQSDRRWPPALLAAVLALALALPDDAMRDDTYVKSRYLETGPRVTELRQSPVPLAQRRPEVVETLASAPWWSDWLRPAAVPQDDRLLDELVAERLEQRMLETPASAGDSARFDAGHAWLRAGHPDRAIRWLQPLADEGFRVYRGGRHPSDPRVLLARAEALEGRAQEAETWLRECLEDHPADPFALAELAALTDAPWAVGQLDRYFGAPDRRWLLGRALRRHGRAEVAVAELAPLAAGLPQLREVHIYLALALGEAGRLDDAIAALLAANRLRSEPVLEVRAMSEIIRRWAAARSDDPQTQLMAARLLHQHGFFAEAAERLHALRQLDDVPDSLIEAAVVLETHIVRPLGLHSSPPDQGSGSSPSEESSP